MSNSSAVSDLQLMVGNDERILWSGKPDKLCFVLECIFNPLLLVAIVFLLFDIFFISLIITDSEFTSMSGAVPGLLTFFIFHLMPLWLYLFGILFVFRKYQHTEYIVTDKAVYISDGIFSYSCNRKPFAELSRVDIRRGVIDQIIGVGDIVLTKTGMTSGIIISDIKEYRQLYAVIKKLQEDIYTDVMYPNDLRPAENHGYQTKYKGM